MILSRTEQLRDYYFCLKKVKKSLVNAEKNVFRIALSGHLKTNFFFEIPLILGT